MEIVLFFSFLAILLAEWMLYPHVAVRRALNDPDELGTYAIPPIAFMTIGALTITQVSEGPWGGHAFTLVAYVIWWIGVVWVFVTCVVVLEVLFLYWKSSRQRHDAGVIYGSCRYGDRCPRGWSHHDLWLHRGLPYHRLLSATSLLVWLCSWPPSSTKFTSIVYWQLDGLLLRSEQDSLSWYV
jgi:hypothetical protein